MLPAHSYSMPIGSKTRTPSSCHHTYIEQARPAIDGRTRPERDSSLQQQSKYPSRPLLNKKRSKMPPSTLAWRCLLPHTAGPLARSSHAMAVVGTTVRVWES